MGSAFSDPADTLQMNRTLAKRRVGQLERLIANQEEKLLSIKPALGDRAGAAVTIALTRGLERHKADLVRAHTVLNEIETALTRHYENEITHDVRELANEIRRNQAEESQAVDEAEIDQFMDSQLQGFTLQSSMPEVPTTNPEKN